MCRVIQDKYVPWSRGGLTSTATVPVTGNGGGATTAAPASQAYVHARAVRPCARECVRVYVFMCARVRAYLGVCMRAYTMYTLWAHVRVCVRAYVDFCACVHVSVGAKSVLGVTLDAISRARAAVAGAGRESGRLGATVARPRGRPTAATYAAASEPAAVSPLRSLSIRRAPCVRETRRLLGRRHRARRRTRNTHRRARPPTRRPARQPVRSINHIVLPAAAAAFTCPRSGCDGAACESVLAIIQAHRTTATNLARRSSSLNNLITLLLFFFFFFTSQISQKTISSTVDSQ